MTSRTVAIKERTPDLSSQATATAIPSSATDGVKVPNVPDYTCQVQVQCVVTGGTGTSNIEIWGYDTKGAAWFMLEEKGTVANEASGLTYRYAFPVQSATQFDRLKTRLKDTPGGTNPAVSTWICFG